jgi:hypothetical protein
VLCTCKTMLNLPETRQMIIKPNLYQGNKQGKLAVLNCNSKQIYIYIYISAMERIVNTAELTIKSIKYLLGIQALNM